MSDDTTTAERRTKRRYAHELYPHPGEFEVRPLHIEVPYLYARALGLEVWGTTWLDRHASDEQREIGMQRTMLLIAARKEAALADALLQGMRLQAAWEWACSRALCEDGSPIYERAMHYGVPAEDIKPYPCGPEPDRHRHRGAPIVGIAGAHTSVPVEGRESDCLECTEPVV